MVIKQGSRTRVAVSVIREIQDKQIKVNIRFYKTILIINIDPRQQNRSNYQPNARIIDSSTRKRIQNTRGRDSTKRRGNLRQQNTSDINRNRNEANSQPIFGRSRVSENAKAGFIKQTETINNTEFATWNHDKAHPMKTSNQLMEGAMRASTQLDLKQDDSNLSRGSTRGRYSRGRGYRDRGRGRGYRDRGQGRMDQDNSSPTNNLDPLSIQMEPQGQWKKNKFQSKIAKDDSDMKKNKVVWKFFLEGRWNKGDQWNFAHVLPKDFQKSIQNPKPAYQSKKSNPVWFKTKKQQLQDKSFEKDEAVKSSEEYKSEESEMSENENSSNIPYDEGSDQINEPISGGAPSQENNSKKKPKNLRKLLTNIRSNKPIANSMDAKAPLNSSSDDEISNNSYTFGDPKFSRFPRKSRTGANMSKLNNEIADNNSLEEIPESSMSDSQYEEAQYIKPTKVK